MPIRLLAIVVACLLAVVNVPGAWAAAATDTVLYVDKASTAAHDSNPGTAAQPLRSISRAVVLADRNNADGLATTIRVMPAVYRERVEIGAGATGAALILEAGGPGVVVSGADRRTDWAPHTAGVQKTAWTHTWGLSAVPAGWPTVEPLLRRREIVAVDGTILRQVLTEPELAAHNGAYFVDEAAGRLLVRPPAGVDLATANVEVAARFHTLNVRRRDNLTIRGITFAHAATDIQRGSVLVDSARNLTVEDSRFEHNNWAGFQMFNVDGATLRRNVFSRNGVMGLTGWRVRDLLAEDNHNSYNNQWRGKWANYGNWEDAMKIAAARRITFRRHTSVGNRGNGLWFDDDVADVTVEDSFLGNNSRYGIFTEISQGPFLIRRNTICNNATYGYLNAKSRSVTIDSNQIFGNGIEAIAISGSVGTHNITNFETGATIGLRNENFTLRNNVVSQGSARLVRNNLQAADWEHLKQTLVSTGNRWHSTHHAPFTLPGVWVDFAKWKSDTGQDLDSVYTAPSKAPTCTSPLPPEPAVSSAGDTSTQPEPTPSPSPSPTAEKDKDVTRLGKPVTIVRKK